MEEGDEMKAAIQAAAEVWYGPWEPNPDAHHHPLSGASRPTLRRKRGYLWRGTDGKEYGLWFWEEGLKG